MTRRKSVHVVPSKGSGWAVKPAGSDRAVSTHRTQAAAIDAGRQIAKRGQAELVTHGRDGRIRDSDSFGNDPSPPIDKKH
jgi:hypothetical protein